MSKFFIIAYYSIYNDNTFNIIITVKSFCRILTHSMFTCEPTSMDIISHVLKKKKLHKLK